MKVLKNKSKNKQVKKEKFKLPEKIKEIIEKINKIDPKNKKIYIIVGISLVLLIITTTFGRYAYNEIKDIYLASKSFYFNSDKLTTNRSIYQIDNWSGVDSYTFTINLNNTKNNLVHAESDIEYELSYVCSSKATCEISKTNGVLYSASTSDYFSATITPNTALKDKDEVWIEITAKSTSPYKKTLSARFILKVGIPGISYAIDDVAGRPYFDLSVTNTTDYYLVKEAFGSYIVNQRIDYNTYKGLSDEDKTKCALPLITLTFDPTVVILDMTATAYLNAENYTTTEIDGYNYVNSISFRIPLESSEAVKFYKADASANYTYPIVNNNSIVDFAYSQ